MGKVEVRKVLDLIATIDKDRASPVSSSSSLDDINSIKALYQEEYLYYILIVLRILNK